VQTAMDKATTKPGASPEDIASKLVDAKLAAAVRSCGLELPHPREIPRLVDLLLGVEEADATAQKFRAIVAMEGYVSAPLEILLSCFDPSDPARQVFADCQTCFCGSLAGADVFCAGKALELAFLWTLACRAGKAEAAWRFQAESMENVRFCCKTVKAGRLFRDTCVELDAGLVKEVEQQTLYFAREGGKDPSHPRADLWFLTVDNVLVLIDVGGAADLQKCMNKIAALEKTVVEQDKRADLKTLGVQRIRGVVLLPNCDVKMEPTSEMEVVSGSPARRLLGGLAQLLTWLGDDLPE